MAGMDFRKLRNEYIRRSLRYSSAVRELYDQALKEISMEFSMLDYDPNLVFSFEKFGKFSDVDRIMTRLEQQIQQTINLAIENEFGAAYKAHESLLKQVLGSNVKEEVWKAFAPRISSGNAALLYMTETATDNITHSTRVWNGAVLGQMETAVQQAMMEGMPAKQMAGLIEKYLNDPDSCFRRFRIKTGVDADGRTMYGRKWKKRVRNKDGSTSWFDADPRDYPTGQGVYHSSYKNALRYTRSSTNIAYRTADFERYQTEAFVLGIEIHTTSNPAHKEDICDLLAGRYPKEFKWVGWHPQCYPDDTEVYTKDGWKLFKDVKDDDLILSLNPQTERLEYVGIAERQCFMHFGKMVHFLNEDIDCLVTPEHQMVYVDRQDGKIKKCCASDYHCLVGPFLGLLDFETVCKLPSRFVKEITDYTGNVYDLTLERNHIMYIRRNGKCFWGSNCMCFQVPILATAEEVNAMADAIIKGQDPASVPVAGRVTDVPDNFKEWVANNQDRIQQSIDQGRQLPYFLRDNGSVVDGKYEMNVYGQPAPSPFDSVSGSFGKATLDDIKNKMGSNFPRTLEHLDDAIKKFTKTNPDFESSRDEIEKALFDLFKDNDFGMDIDSDVLESVYKNGFYNQFQSGTSNGSLYEPGKTTGKIGSSNRRLMAAHEMFGLGDSSFNQLERHEYEKYGHLLDRDMLNAIKYNLSGYGNTQVRFKKDRVVCTWTFDDSLGLEYQPSLTSDPKIESLDFIPTKYKPKASDPKELFQWQNEKMTQYIELQYHGNLTIDDVESIVFKSRPDNLITLDLIKRLIGKGIKLFYYEGGAVVEYIL